MPEPEKVDASSQPCATGMQQQAQPYKALLKQQLQKLKKQQPVYQNQNEGSGHQPKFRSSVWVDGEKYTSPNTFLQRKAAEMDASKIALLALMLKLKNEALHHVREDKTFCKSILIEYGARMNIQKPTYETVQTGAPVAVFRSTVVFNGVSYTGDECRAKKEAQQSAARVVILKYLESETGNILSEIIKSKFNHFVTQMVVNEAKMDEVTKLPPTSEIPTQTIPVTQTLLVGTNNVPTYSPPVQTIPIPTVLAKTPVAQFQTPVPEISTPVVSAPTNHSQQPTTATEIPAPTVSVPTVMAQNPSTIPENHPLVNVVEAINTEAPSVTVASTSSPNVTGKKRNRKSKKNAQKRIKSETQVVMSALFHGQLPAFSAQ